MKTRGCLLTEDLPGDPAVCPLIGGFVDDLYDSMPDDVFRRYISMYTYHVAGTRSTDASVRQRRRVIAVRELLRLVATVHGKQMARDTVPSLRKLKPRRIGEELSESFDALAETVGSWEQIAMHAARVLLELCRVSTHS